MILLTGYGSSSIDGFPIWIIYAAMAAGFLTYGLVMFGIFIWEEIQYYRDEEVLRKLDEIESKNRHG